MSKHRHRSCAFCGGGPLTNEDAWPRWLNRHLPPSSPGTALDLSLTSNEVVRASRRTVTSYNTARVRAVCKTCNNGWMSRLEKSAAPILLPMIRGTRSLLDEDQQAVVAAWVTKTAFVFDQRALGRQPLVSTEITQGFGETRRPIAGSRVLLAHYTGADWLLNHAVSGLPAVYRDGREKVVVAIVTLCVGQLAMQLLCPTDLAETDTPSNLRRDDGAFTVQLQPRTSDVASWPPRIGLASRDWFELGLTSSTSVDVAGLLDTTRPPRPSA